MSIDDPETQETRGADQKAFLSIDVPPGLGSLWDSAAYFVPDDALISVVKDAQTVGMPLLITGEPGTGKTQVAYWLARYLDVPLFPLESSSTTTRDDLLYRFDTIRYFHEGHDPDRPQGHKLDRMKFIEKGPLWQAFLAEKRSVVLIDEIDKAPKDFPNDLLHALDQHAFQVTYLRDDKDRPQVIERPKGRPPPLVVITSNRERRLPDPFLRRCLVHHIDLTEKLVKEAIAKRRGVLYDLDEGVITAAIDAFWRIRRKGLRKSPATAELLIWLTLLDARRCPPDDLAKKLRADPLRDLPAIRALVKDEDDYKKL